MKKRSKKMTKIVTNAKKCPTTHKSMFSDEKTANRVMMRIWSHDSKADIRDLHTYICPDCGSYHVGHKSYFEIAQKRNENINQPIPATLG